MLNVSKTWAVNLNYFPAQALRVSQYNMFLQWQTLKLDNEGKDKLRPVCIIYLGVATNSQQCTTFLTLFCVRHRGAHRKSLEHALLVKYAPNQSRSILIKLPRSLDGSHACSHMCVLFLCIQSPYFPASSD